MSNPLRIGVAGLGTVGTALVNLLDNKRAELIERCGRETVVTAVTARSQRTNRDCDISNAQWFDNPVDLATSDNIDVYVELMGGDEGVAADSVRAALNAGKHVVTANKALLAKHGVEFAKLAEENGTLLNFEAAVAGGIPIIKTMRESLTSNNVIRVYGIMNGTCNYMLTRMEEEGLSFEDCLQQAQELGYAEADPTFDVGGHDTMHKLALLTSLAFGTEIAVDEIYLEGITKITPEDIEAAKDLGYSIKLLGVTQKTDTGIEQRVHPTMVPLAAPIAQIGGVTNAVVVEADVVGELMMTGPGAGGDATASAVAGDIADIAKSRPGHQHVPSLGKPAVSLTPYVKSRMRTHRGGYFIRLNLNDKAGSFAAIASRMAEQDISLESIVQRREANSQNSDSQPVIMITHDTTEEAISAALKAINSDGHLKGDPQMIRIEKLGFDI
jgi:homoserine dehydrogenase